jgi:hypothetical protein
MIRKLMLSTAIMMAALGGTAGAASAAPAHVAAAPAHVATATLASVAVPAANDCNFPTQPLPGSQYVQSYTYCDNCATAAFWNNANPFNLDRFYYCTYNPSNNENDLHYNVT